MSVSHEAPDMFESPCAYKQQTLLLLKWKKGEKSLVAEHSKEEEKHSPPNAALVEIITPFCFLSTTVSRPQTLAGLKTICRVEVRWRVYQKSAAL